MPGVRKEVLLPPRTRLPDVIGDASPARRSSRYHYNLFATDIPALPGERSHQGELVIDQTGKPWVLEVNTAPGLATDATAAKYAETLKKKFGGTSLKETGGET